MNKFVQALKAASKDLKSFKKEIPHRREALKASIDDARKQLERAEKELDEFEELAYTAPLFYKAVGDQVWVLNDTSLRFHRVLGPGNYDYERGIEIYQHASTPGLWRICFCHLGSFRTPIFLDFTFSEALTLVEAHMRGWSVSESSARDILSRLDPVKDLPNHLRSHPARPRKNPSRKRKEKESAYEREDW